MARIIRVLLVLAGFIFTVCRVNCEPVNLSTLVTVQNVPFEQCTKIFNIDAENRFQIDEIQSKTGYILFNAVNKEFLASVVKLDSKNSLLRVTPANNVYYFQPGIVLNLFKYIELNGSVKPVVLPVK